MYSNSHEEEEEHCKITHRPQGIVGHQEWRQDLGDVVQLVADTDEDERGDEDIGHRVRGNEDQHAMGVSCQPHVILTHKQLQGDAAKPGKEGGVASPQDPDHVPEHDEACDLGKRTSYEVKIHEYFKDVMRWTGQEGMNKTHTHMHTHFDLSQKA